MENREQINADSRLRRLANKHGYSIRKGKNIFGDTGYQLFYDCHNQVEYGATDVTEFSLSYEETVEWLNKNGDAVEKRGDIVNV